MPTITQIRPTGFLYGPPAKRATASGDALALGDTGTAFAGAELRTRDLDNSATLSYMSVKDLANSADESIKSILARITAPRPSFAGLYMDRPTIMGIVNVTPDSFSDGGKFNETSAAVDHALKLADEGADVLDIGGESTRPGAKFVEIEEELSRVVPVIKALRDQTHAKISVDTRKAPIMRAAADAGADILNDVSALSFDPDAANAAAQTGLPIILMHAQGTPQTMQDDPTYDDALMDIYDYLDERMSIAEQAGIPRERMMTDPGIGFGKDLDHNLQLLNGMSIFHGLGAPILLGVSRKRVLGQLADEPEAEKRMPGSVAAALTSIAQGVQMVRVHDVAETRQAIGAWQACMAGADIERLS